MKLPKELKEKEKKKIMKIRKKKFKQPIEVKEIKENDELLIKGFLFHCYIKNIPIADLKFAERTNYWMNFLDKLETNKDKKNIYSELY